MARSPMTSELETLLRDPGTPWARLRDILKALPDEVDPTAAAQAVLRLIRDGAKGTWFLARNCRRLPAPVIRAALEQLGEVRRPQVYFLRECVPRDAGDTETREAWATALQALLDLDTTYAWGSKQRKAKLQALADSPRLLQAIQTAAVACEEVSLDMLAVLAADASEASLDALIPHVERAVTKQDWKLDRLQQLRTHARATPAMDAMFSRMKELLDTRRARSPALELARALGFGAPTAFWFRAHIGSPAFEDAPAYQHQVNLEVDSRAPQWFRVALTGFERSMTGPARRTRFSSEQVYSDELGVGPCEPTALPGWLAEVATKLGTRWSFDTMSLTTSVRGKKRDELARWLRGAG